MNQVHSMNGSSEVHERPKPEYLGEHGQDSGYHQTYKVGFDEVEIYPSHYADEGGFVKEWAVIWNGAVDYEGNKRDLLKRYPEFKGEL
jgi:hypothetical protein